MTIPEQTAAVGRASETLPPVGELDPLMQWIRQLLGQADVRAPGALTVLTEDRRPPLAVHVQTGLERNPRYPHQRLLVVAGVAIDGQVQKGIYDIAMHRDPPVKSCAAATCRAYRADEAAGTLTNLTPEWDPHTLPLVAGDVASIVLLNAFATAVEGAAGPHQEAHDPVVNLGARSMLLQVAASHALDPTMVGRVVGAQQAAIQGM